VAKTLFAEPKPRGRWSLRRWGVFANGSLQRGEDASPWGE
jgi:hypothetical protein